MNSVVKMHGINKVKTVIMYFFFVLTLTCILYSVCILYVYCVLYVYCMYTYSVCILYTVTPCD